jgi:hypothetical protein
MKRMVALLLISLLTAPPIAAVQQSGSQSDWLRVQRLEPGADITVSAKDRPSAKAWLLYAGNVSLVTLMPTDPKLPTVVMQVLFGIGSQWVAVLDGSLAVQSGSVRVSKQDGIVNGSAKVADLAQAVQETPCEDIREIRGPVTHRGSSRLAAILAAVGGGIALASAPGYLTSEGSSGATLAPRGGWVGGRARSGRLLHGQSHRRRRGLPGASDGRWRPR